MANWSLPTISDTWANIIAFLKNRTEDLARMFDPATTTATNVPTNAIRWSSANSRFEKYNGSSWAALSGSYAISITGSAGSVAFSGITGKPTTLSGYGITDAQPLDADLTALAGLASTAGLLARTGAGAFAARTLIGPAAGLTITNGNGQSGNPTIALAHDLAAVENIATTGGVERTGTNTWTTFTLTAFAKTLLDDANATAALATLGAPALATVNAWTIQQKGPTAALTDGTNIAWNLNTHQNASVTLGGNRTLSNPTNQVAGSNYVLRVIQDGTGNRTLAFGSAYKWSGGVAPALSTSAGAVDIFVFHSDGTNMHGAIMTQDSR